MEATQLREKHQIAEGPSQSEEYRGLLRAGPRLRLLRQAHAHLVVSGCHRSRALLTKLIILACTAGSITYTRRLFYSVVDPDSFLFNSLIKASSKFGFSLDAIIFYRHMLLAGIPPSTYTFTSVIKACADLSSSRSGRAIHTLVFVNGYGTDSFAQAALVTFYAKSSNLGIARSVFDKMPDRTIVAWNSMISGYEQNGLAKEALELFQEMCALNMNPDSATLASVLAACSQLGSLKLGCWGISNNIEINVILGTSLINMFSRCGEVKRAREVFDNMPKRNVIVWTAMISGYGTHNYGSQAMELFNEMKANGPPPNTVTFVAVLSACAHAGLVHEGQRAFTSMKQDYGLVPGVEHHICMVDMLGRAGLLNQANHFIKQLHHKDLIPAIWTAMLGACKMHKNLDLSVEVAERLLYAEPDNPGHYVLLSNVFASAGSSRGAWTLWQWGQFFIFKQMKTDL